MHRRLLVQISFKPRRLPEITQIFIDLSYFLFEYYSSAILFFAIGSLFQISNISFHCNIIVSFTNSVTTSTPPSIT